MNLWTKLIGVPVSNATKQIQAVQLWEVRWTSRRGKEPFDRTQPEMEAFVSRERAEYFRDALVNAFALVRNTTDSNVELSEVKLDDQGNKVAA